MHDLIVQNGTLVDGSGAPPRAADVAVSDGVIRGVGSDLGPARRTLDASDRLVTPGFVDIHTHYDGQATWDALPHPLRRAGHLGCAAHTFQLARRHHPGDGQLRCGLRARGAGS
jgi:N-acyl-D-aspartate/D-glutamate deacylase